MDDNKNVISDLSNYLFDGMWLSYLFQKNGYFETYARHQTNS